MLKPTAELTECCGTRLVDDEGIPADCEPVRCATCQTDRCTNTTRCEPVGYAYDRLFIRVCADGCTTECPSCQGAGTVTLDEAATLHAAQAEADPRQAAWRLQISNLERRVADAVARHPHSDPAFPALRLTVGEARLLLSILPPF